MTPDMVSELLRQLMKEALILSAPLLIATILISFVLSLFQTLTSLQEQSLTFGAAPDGDRDDSAGGNALVSGAGWRRIHGCCWWICTGIPGERQWSRLAFSFSGVSVVSKPRVRHRC
jgi:hypothetical protein